MHHLLEVNQDDPQTTRRTMNELGRMYHDLLQDYARAAYWWQRAGVDKDSQFGRSGPHLAECYWRLGRRDMAVQLLDKLSKGTHGGVLMNCIKAWGDMGELQKAEAVANRLGPGYQRQGFSAGEVFLLMGDACRAAGRFSQAARYYERVVSEPANLKGRVDAAKKRAEANLEAIKLFEQSDVSRVADGKHRAESLGYEGPLEVEVEVQAHRIVDVRVTQHKEKQFYSALTDTPAKIIQKNGVKGVDTTSSATITSEAIINAAAKALASGAK
jgi:uncharacterized protein with FMN-binding domain